MKAIRSHIDFACSSSLLRRLIAHNENDFHLHQYCIFRILFLCWNKSPTFHLFILSSFVFVSLIFTGKKLYSCEFYGGTTWYIILFPAFYSEIFQTSLRPQTHIITKLVPYLVSKPNMYFFIPSKYCSL